MKDGTIKNKPVKLKMTEKCKDLYYSNHKLVMLLTFHWPSNAIGHIIRVPPRAFFGTPLNSVLFEARFSVSVCLASGIPLPGLASIRLIVITVFPSPIASAKI